MERKIEASGYISNTAAVRAVEKRVDEMDMSMSEWVESMVEAGQKKFGYNLEPNNPTQQLREERNELQEELNQFRKVVANLESHVNKSVQELILEYLQQNPGVTTTKISLHVASTVSQRVPDHLEEMMGTEVWADDGNYYLVGEQGE